MTMSGLRLCVACDDPSPGPLKQLYYRPRTFGPYFPVLEERKKKENSNLYSGGRATVCTGCASHLQRQWTAYEKAWTPVERRFFKLRSEEQEEKKIGQGKGRVPMATKQEGSGNSPRDKFHNHTIKDKRTLSDGSGTSTEDRTPFQRAVRKVTKQNKENRESHGLARLQAVIDQARDHAALQTGPQWTRDRPDGGMADGETRAAVTTKTSLLWKLPREVIRSHVRDEMEESIDIMIRKLAEIQHLENVKQSEQALKEAAERVTKAHDRERDINRMVQELKARFREELGFKETGRVLKEERDATGNKDENSLKVARKPQDIGGVLSVTRARKAGKAWKKKIDGQVSTDQNALVPSLPSISKLEKIPELEGQTLLDKELDKRRQEEEVTKQELQAVKQELEKEKEWRKKTEVLMTKQKSMIDELRQGIQGEIAKLLQEQAKRHEELRASLTNELENRTVKIPENTRNGIEGEEMMPPREKRPIEKRPEVLTEQGERGGAHMPIQGEEKQYSLDWATPEN
ncbi:predicted protein [Nematostella vectensis]|uniref:Uncharacterized protein n=1 Tax=Nematostella vectensis TaxID=45351 RepID=A7RTU4_NEMVE|nr:predicted protein [Nematostella vectensis]|eukprot:XP_001637154.1 predicted protein [Nematostella vectensis]